MLWVPLAATAPDHPPEAVHAVALLELQVNVEDSPLLTVAGAALSVAVGALGELPPPPPPPPQATNRTAAAAIRGMEILIASRAVEESRWGTIVGYSRSQCSSNSRPKSHPAGICEMATGPERI